jgi:hypothetical protein
MYMVREWFGDRSSILATEAFGLETATESTANVSGRIDAYAIEKGALILRKVRLTLKPSSRGVAPAIGRRLPVAEIDRRWRTISEENIASGRTIVVDVSVPASFTGLLVARLERADDRVVVLKLENGRLISERESARPAQPDPRWEPLAPRPPVDVVLRAVGENRREVFRELALELRGVVDVDVRRGWLDHSPATILRAEPTVRAERLSRALTSAGASVDVN